MHAQICLQILLRKGGIKEPTFKPAAREFLLFPTSFHTDAQVRCSAPGTRSLGITSRCDHATRSHMPELRLSNLHVVVEPVLRGPPPHSPHAPAHTCSHTHRDPCCLQLLKPDAAQRYAAECAFDPKAHPTLRFGTWAALTGAWTTADPAVLRLLDELHVWGADFLVRRPCQAWLPEPVPQYPLSNIGLAAAGGWAGGWDGRRRGGRPRRLLVLRPALVGAGMR